MTHRDFPHCRALNRATACPVIVQLHMAPYSLAVQTRLVSSGKDGVRKYVATADPEWTAGQCVSAFPTTLRQTERSVFPSAGHVEVRSRTVAFESLSRADTCPLGYLLGMMIDAATQFQSSSTHKDPLHTTVHFLSSVAVGPLEIHVKRLRAGKMLSSLTVDIVQGVAFRHISFLFDVMLKPSDRPTPEQLHIWCTE
jgi:Thioesterase-like superfamily